MNYDNKIIAGLLLFVVAVQFVLVVVISEAIYSGYSVGQQYVIDLGDWSLAGNSAAIFDASIIWLARFFLPVLISFSEDSKTDFLPRFWL